MNPPRRSGSALCGSTLAVFCTALLLLFSSSPVGSFPPDGITVQVQCGAAPDEVVMTWTGGLATFHVYRSDVPQNVSDPGNELGTTDIRTWTDVPPPGGIFFYMVSGGVCFPTGPEVCDGVDNDCDGTTDGPGSEASCDLANAGPVCVDGACAIDQCDAGYGDCDAVASNGCETDVMTTTAHCGACGAACVNPHGTTACEFGICTPTCDTTWDDCDGDPANGCETSLETLSDCGACGVVCDLAHASESCATTACEITACDPDWGDCDAAHSNGCETDLTTLTDCGGCSVECDLPNATESCATGSCQVDSCETGYGNCDGSQANGCEAPLNTLTNCGGCGVTCDLAHASESCATGSCELTACDVLWGNCDGNEASGCETSLRTLTDCGGCGIPCDYINAVESCQTGSCTFQGCNAGYGDCDSNLTNGCETSLWSPSDCGYCDYTCPDIPHATETCPSGICDFSCDSFWHDCNGYQADGCEVTTSHTPSNSCSSAPYLGSKCGDAHCGLFCTSTTVWSTLTQVSGQGSYWYAARALECNSCPGRIYMRATLTPPPGSDFDLHVFTDCNHEVGQSTTSGDAVEQVTYSVDDTIFNDDFDYRVKVVWRGGPFCAHWTLKLEGRRCPD